MVNTTVYLFETDRTSRVGMVGGMVAYVIRVFSWCYNSMVARPKGEKR